MTSDAHEYTVYIVTYTVVVVCLFVCFRGEGGLKSCLKAEVMATEKQSLEKRNSTLICY